ncbi:MAG TPA: MATE family efflux transporter [Candidatus Anaerostipes excrementavium]|uniref:MATE family efflux transporter n=1 Tax=Candidatus Anaerostipes excrementavium TaxID=2838463 RepID=A0A9D1WWK8_9FIRM|nr:MATE family efflux transporter [uncultured Anaerostipes sp.]HIX68574.1 MATE family efflux transporter [Candidatus Anaerostipes excrementavium]
MSEFHTTEDLLENNSIRSLVLKLGIPAMLGQFFNILYSIVDRIFVGQIPQNGEIALASIGICAPMLVAVTAFAYMVGIGGASYMSISLGEKNRKRAEEIIGNSFLLLIGISLVVTVVLLGARKPVLYMLGCSDAMYPYAKTYFTIYICGTIASLCGVGLNQFLLAQGFAREGMIAVIISAVMNAILDPILIYGFDLGVAGAAAATVISQCSMAVFVLLKLCSRKVPIRLVYHKLRFNIAKKIISIGSMSFLITLLDNLIIILLNVALQKYGGPVLGDQLIVCATVVQSLMTIVFCPAQGITSGCGTIFSYHYGAGHYKKICQAFIGVFVLCGIYIGALQIGIQMMPKVFAGLFLQDDQLIQMAAGSIRMYTLALIGVAVQYALVDELTAMGKIRFALPLSLFRKILYIVCIFVLPLFFDVRCLFYAGSISDGIGASFSLILFFFFIRPKLKKELQEKQ